MYIYIHVPTHSMEDPNVHVVWSVLQWSVYSHLREPGSGRTRKILLPNLHTLVSSGGTCRRHSSQQASSPLSQPPAREHFFLHTTVESCGPRGKQIKTIPIRTKRPPWPCLNNPRLTASNTVWRFRILIYCNRSFIHFKLLFVDSISGLWKV